MKSKSRYRIIISFTLILFFFGFLISTNDLIFYHSKINDTNSPSELTEPKPIYKDTEEEIAYLIDSIKLPDAARRERTVARLFEIAEKNDEKKARVTLKLVGELRRMCDQSGSVSFDLFQQGFTISHILADLQSMEALDALTDCANTTPPGHTQAINDFLSMSAIIKYREKAIPELRRKLNGNRADIKCRLASILTSIGGSEVETILKEAQGKETDEEILYCLRRSLSAFRIHKKLNQRK